VTIRSLIPIQIRRTGTAGRLPTNHIEVDPMRDLCYLHGFVERRGRDNSTEKYVAFFMANATPEAEEEAFRGAWQYISQSQPCAIYYY